MSFRRSTFIICTFLVVSTLTVYWQVAHHDFINLDDPSYVTENQLVQSGVTKKGLIWALTESHAANWHPLTWASHMLDCQLFGLKPGQHHLINVLFHIANSLLLFGVIRKMTGALWRSAFVAALFALHPLHVESVAWVAERKDVLSTFFWMLCMWVYADYTKRPRIGRYFLVAIFFTLGLLAKPMVVTLPFVLLLMDYWPLGRLKFSQGNNNTKSTSNKLPIPVKAATHSGAFRPPVPVDSGRLFQMKAATDSGAFRPPRESERSDAGFSIFRNCFDLSSWILIFS